MRFLPPSCRFPPLREGNPIGSVPPACRFPLLREGNQKGAVPPACRGNLKEGVRNFAYFRTLSGVGGGCSKIRGREPHPYHDSGRGTVAVPC
jgi:hypothetical protein